MGPVAHYRRRSKADGVLSMFQRYRGNKSVNKPTERTATRHALGATQSCLSIWN